MTPDVNFCAVLEHHAHRSPDALLASMGAETITYGEMLDRSARLAAGLRNRGVEDGSVVGLLAYNSIEFLEVMFAVNHVGAALMPINWRLAAPEVAYILGHSEAVAVVADAGLVGVADAAIAVLDSAPERWSIGTVENGNWTALDDVRGTQAIGREAAGADDLHRLMYTSGTTGRPKGVMITHANLAWKNLAHLVEFAFTSTDIGLACGPLYHVGALDLTTTTLVAAGASTVVHRTFDATAVVDEIERSGVTVVWLAPAMVNAILDLDGIEERDLSSIRLVIGGGEKMPIPLIERLRRVFPNAWFADAYGLTETVSGDTFLDRDSTITKLGSCGRACLYLEIQIWDEACSSVPAGVAGEVVLRGPKVFPGYWRDPEATDRAFAGGWFHTGDVGVLDEDGYLFIVDRLKDMIVSGGENIASSEVERVLYEHPAVLEAAVVGRPDDRWGEVPVAYVVRRSGTGVSGDELIEWCRGRLAKFKVPVAVHFPDALPRNPSGKVLKRELRTAKETKGTS
ncbi:acyl-CoA synthetase [Candidatus Poriferisocius sp.]|uniref:acyl-CoA synthetase n=1 Tax=Candidatus Poriferisocius sp. TaxID=3101276 RepID=UPI003B5B917E